MFLGRIDELETTLTEFLRRWERKGSPTMIGFGLYGLALAARAKGDNEEAGRLLDRMLSLDRPPNTWNADEMLDALHRFEQGKHQQAFAKLSAVVEENLKTETHYMALTICRYCLTILSRLDRPQDVARIMGFYRASITGQQQSPLTAEADSYLDTRMSAELRHEIAAGAELTNQQALEHLLAVLSRLQTVHQ